MKWNERIEKLEAGIRHLSDQRRTESQSGAEKTRKQLRADLADLKEKAKAQDDNRLAVDCLRLLLHEADVTPKTSVGIEQNSNLDEHTAIRIAKAFLHRHEAKDSSVVFGDSLPQDTANSEMKQTEPPAAQSEDTPPDESADRIQATHRCDAARQLPPAWLSSKW